jgi:hypothetical protein
MTYDLSDRLRPGRQLLDRRARTVDCRRRSAAQRVQCLLFGRVGGRIQPTQAVGGGSPEPVLLDRAERRVKIGCVQVDGNDCVHGSPFIEFGRGWRRDVIEPTAQIRRDGTLPVWNS